MILFAKQFVCAFDFGNQFLKKKTFKSKRKLAHILPARIALGLSGNKSEDSARSNDLTQKLCRNFVMQN